MSKESKSFIEKKTRQLQKKEYEKLAIQNLPKRLIKMQKKQLTYNVGNFFLFDLLGHPFMTTSLLRMFKGKSLFKMCLFLHKKCIINFDSYNSDTKLEKLFNNPNLDRIRILDEKIIKKEEYTSSESSCSPPVTKKTGKINLKGLTSKHKKNKKKNQKKHKDNSAKKIDLMNRSNEYSKEDNLGLYRDNEGFNLINTIRKEENILKTRIFFENEKLRRLLQKNDDILELELTTNKMKALRNKISKSRIRNVFKKILWTSDLDICVHFSEDGHLFEVKDAFECQDLNYVRFSFLKDKESEENEKSFMKLDDKQEEKEYQRELDEDHIGEYNVLLIKNIPSRKSSNQQNSISMNVRFMIPKDATLPHLKRTQANPLYCLNPIPMSKRIISASIISTFILKNSKKFYIF
jgi:hypothetical protein